MCWVSQVVNIAAKCPPPPPPLLSRPLMHAPRGVLIAPVFADGHLFDPLRGFTFVYLYLPMRWRHTPNHKQSEERWCVRNSAAPVKRSSPPAPPAGLTSAWPPISVRAARLPGRSRQPAGLGGAPPGAAPAQAAPRPWRFVSGSAPGRPTAAAPVRRETQHRGCCGGGGWRRGGCVC